MPVDNLAHRVINSLWTTTQGDWFLPAVRRFSGLFLASSAARGGQHEPK